MIKINCDLCGKREESLNMAIIEGVELSVCKDCSKFGKVLAPIKRYSPKEQHRMIQRAQENKIPKEEKIEILVENYAELVKKKRESLGLSQKDFALKINEKESTISHIETREFEPSMHLAKRLERMLGIKLLEEYEEKHETAKRKSEEGFTLGDFIKVKK